MSRVEFPGGVESHPSLSSRQRQVFSALVEIHSRTARPVGSETLVDEGEIGLSAASIRSTLSELEALGLLLKPHTSAGRVPSAAGYRLYVRSLLQPAPLDPELLAYLDSALRRSTRDVEHLLGEASRLLSEFSRQLGVALTPQLSGGRLDGLELIPAHERRVVLALTLRGGLVRTLVLELESSLKRSELEEVARVLRDRLLEHDLEEVHGLLASDPALVRDSAVRLVARALLARWQTAAGPSLFAMGASHIASQPEFQGTTELPSLLRMMESGSGIDRILLEGVEGQASVRVGMDEAEALRGCSLVSYRLPGSLRGAIGILGPMRMDYSRVVALVEQVGLRLDDLL